MPCPFCNAPREARPGNFPYELFECGTLIADGKTYRCETCEDICRDKPKMLFVWAGFCPDHKKGLAFAIASSVDEARYLVKIAYGGNPYEWGPMDVFSLTDPRAFAVHGG